MMVWLNGKWLENEEAAVSASDSGFLRGEGVFETMLSLHGRIFQLAAHWERFERGCRLYGIEPIELERAAPVVKELIERNSFPPNARTRVRVTQSRESLLFSAQESPDYPKRLRLRTSRHRRNEHGALVGVKAISYGENAIALAEGKREGAHEVLFANTQGDWCEGAWSNIFAVENETLFTPPLASGCLPGVTRELVIKLAKEAGIEVKEEDRSLDSLARVKELFLTSSLLGVGPVGEFDERELKTGGTTTQLARLLTASEQQAAELS